jgi:hypothetical protein
MSAPLSRGGPRGYSASSFPVGAAEERAHAMPDAGEEVLGSRRRQTGRSGRFPAGPRNGADRVPGEDDYGPSCLAPRFGVGGFVHFPRRGVMPISLAQGSRTGQALIRTRQRGDRSPTCSTRRPWRQAAVAGLIALGVAACLVIAGQLADRGVRPASRARTRGRTGTGARSRRAGDRLCGHGGRGRPSGPGQPGGAGRRCGPRTLPAAPPGLPGRSWCG